MRVLQKRKQSPVTAESSVPANVMVASSTESEFKFKEGDKVLYLYETLMHEAFILKAKKTKRAQQTLYFVTIPNLGPPNKWVEEENLVTYNEEGLAKQEALWQAYCDNWNKEKVTTRASLKRKMEEKRPQTNQQSQEKKKKLSKQKKNSKSLEEDKSNKNKKSPTNCTAAAPSSFTSIAQVKYGHLLIKIFTNSLDQNPRQFYFEPLVLLDPKSIEHLALGFFNQNSIRFTLQMWNEDVRLKVLERLRIIESLRDVKIEEEDICVMPFEEVQLVCKPGGISHSIRLVDQPTSYLRSNEHLDFYLLCDVPSNVLAHDFRQNAEFVLNQLGLKLECRGLNTQSGITPTGSTLPERPIHFYSIFLFLLTKLQLPESAAGSSSTKSTVSLDFSLFVPENKAQSDSAEVAQQLRSSNHSGSSDSILDDDVTTGQLDVSAVKIKKCPDGARLSWNPPQITAGEITGYSVFLAVNRSSATTFSFTRVYCGRSPKCTVPNLTQASAYVDRTTKPAIIFTIAARNEKGFGPDTQVNWVQDSSTATSAKIKPELIKLEPDDPGEPENTTASGSHSRS